MSASETSQPSRREFLNTSGRIAAASALLGAAPAVHAAENNTIKVALIGCGGRGTGAAENALSTKGPTELVAMADVFDDRLQGSLRHLSGRFPKQVNVPEERQFIGFDAYRKAIDAVEGGGVVILATPPGFRPLHVEYAISKGCHVFMEKAMAVDGPGVRRLLAAGKEADRKNLKIAAGLMSRHYTPLIEAVRRIHDGIIGDVITCWAYREHGPVGLRPKAPGMTEMAHQIRNFHNFNWLGGSFILDWLIHNIDVCCWTKDAWPVSAQGQGGRQVRTEPDQMFDHYAVEYSYGDGTRMFAQARHMADCFNFWGCIIHGTKGCAVMGEGIPDPLIYKGHKRTDDNIIWRFTGDKGNHYQAEHDLLFDAIRSNKPYNETERAAYATLAGILGRMAAESGQEITWEQALNSDLVLAPGIENYTMDSQPPVVPDAEGRYPIAMPGKTKVV
ncbi:MAG TPA: Gfo/Idh/MocA family oxidoreductase [Phycisphaerae bacterium]|nr:Gfo/Idh/MocA family oxidoreductase [Phycisphaerae bacterium]HOJ73112.1 Gfo/Idh/MocA family oxidoreductase [Phycisphaerae bacterium]HOM52728.1 Gfo/Idh/MocA family oxidoreductase [Phycisphaerae bacterium]HON65313.1 Gfo/Idh/MocA family oxidoreductase [Phycisphaerae bacterium]HOQ86320.1 Gfo/Idh/MocA family oxidoreductase [Phycisphaerae bacterium]